MRKFALLFISVSFLVACNNTKPGEETSDTWSNAQWIAFEKLEDNLRVVPGVHGSGDKLDNKCVKRSVVPMFRKEFTASNPIKEATISICGLGHYDLYINGDRVGNSFLSPGWTYYQKRYLYNTYDISTLVKEGDNALGVIVGNGFYNINRERYRKLVIAYGYPKLIFNIILKYEDGSVTNIISDNTVKVRPSPVTFSSIFGGEDYNANLEQEGWNAPGFDDSEWQIPVITDDSVSKLKPELDYPLKVMQEFEVQKVSISKTGRTIYDFGQNASGIISLKVSGSKGVRIRIRPDELVNSEGDITQRSGGGPYEFNYTLKGEGIEEWQPRFTYYGFRYADVEIIEPENPDKKTEIIELKMLHTRNSSPQVGTFSCSDTLFNQIFELINWGIKSNMASVATDCPHREKLGWLEQGYLIGPSMHYNFDIQAFYSKIVDDMIDSQLENGLVPDIAPEYVPFSGGFRNSPEWGSASVIIPWLVYKWYGDEDILKKAYPMMKRYVAYLQSKSQNNMLDHGLGDWYDLGPGFPGEAQLTPKAVTATLIYFYNLEIIAKVAKKMGFDDDYKVFNTLSVKIQEAFLEEYYNAETGLCSTGSQTAYAMSLYTGMIPVQDKEMVFDNLIDSIKQNDYALTSGDIGYHFLVRVLSENGRSDVLYKMNNRSDRPGYAYQLKKGATSLTESWAALPEVSNNHMMLGHLMEWFYSGLGGIYQADNSVAYSDVIIAPKPVGNISWVKCSYLSAKGPIISDWKIEADAFVLNIEVPEKASAKVILPEGYRGSSCKVTDLTKERAIKIEISDGAFKVEPGKYKIIAK
ncbi:MAG: family 78 glycoside hydrolase catalytic domain [Bacteroidales bacterium]|nr:family 78 glycoside hydrolase catalytic domain [Bacteroidales bacterium]